MAVIASKVQPPRAAHSLWINPAGMFAYCSLSSASRRLDLG